MRIAVTPPVTVSSCSTVLAAGMRRNGCGWVTSASGASSRTSMPFCGARGRIASRSSSGDTAPLSNVKYVITLDTDTQLPRDTARQFVGVMAHPLNRARFGGRGRRNSDKLVTEGYGILQPRVGISLPGANRSWYARLHGGDPGIDPYTRAVSDVYQDVFHEGSFIGKGIYDVDAFEQALNEPLSREQDPESRPHRGLLRPVGPLERRAVVRGISVDLQRRHGSPSPVDSRRLAARGLAAAARSRPRPTPGQESAVRAFTLEALRQPAAQPRPGGADARAPARMDRASACLVVDAGGARGSAASIGLRLHRAVAHEGGRRDAETAPRRHRKRCGPRRRANGADACLPAL